MRPVLFLSLVLLVCLSLAVATDLSASSDHQLGALLSNNWYDLLPAKIRDEKSELLKLLQPTQSSGTEAHHLALQVRNRHMLSPSNLHF